MPYLEFKEITKTYSGHNEPVLKNLSFNVSQGDIVTILGPSGCGKTTILRVIAGFEKFQEGILKIDGQTIAGKNIWLPPEKRNVGFVFQNYALFPHMTVYDNIGFGLPDSDKSKSEKIDNIIRMTGLSNFCDKYPCELSGGQQQRVAVSRALIRNPSLLLLDEPFSNIDPSFRNEMRNEIKSIIRKMNITAIFVTHDQKEALSLSDKIILIKSGQLEQQDNPENLYMNPKSPFAASFVSCSNIIKGEITEGQSNIALTSVGKLEVNNKNNIHGNVLLSINPYGFYQADNGSIPNLTVKNNKSGRISEFSDLDNIAITNMSKLGSIKVEIVDKEYHGSHYSLKLKILQPDNQLENKEIFVYMNSPTHILVTGNYLYLNIHPEYISVMAR